MKERLVVVTKRLTWEYKVIFCWIFILILNGGITFLFPAYQHITVPLAPITLIIPAIVYLKRKGILNKVIGSILSLVPLSVILLVIMMEIPIKHPYTYDYPGDVRRVDDKELLMNFKVNEHFHIVSVGELEVKTKFEDMVAFWRGVGFKDRTYILPTDSEKQYMDKLVYTSTNEAVFKPVLAVMNELKMNVNYTEVARVSVPRQIDGFLQNGDEILSINDESSVSGIIYWTRFPDLIPGDQNEQVSVSVKGRNEKVVMTKQAFKDSLVKTGAQVRSEFLSLDQELLPVKVLNKDARGDSSSLSRALEIYQQLTGENLVKGRKIAATGGIQTDGRITDIGGLYFKYHTLMRENVDVFVVPKYGHQKELENYFKLGRLPKEMKIIYADTLMEAVQELRK